MGERFRPTDEGELREVMAWALAGDVPLEVVGGGSKRHLGRATNLEHTLETAALSGIRLYEPAELVMTAAAGTPLAEIEAALAGHRQHLAFEPADYRRLLGGDGAPTIGGVFAANLSGPRRIAAGAARDHILGVRCVSGRGESFKAGGRVVKNVTGFDVPKLVAGSYGTLAVMSEVTFKVLPAPEDVRTIVVAGLPDAAAVAALGEALRTPYEVSGAAHLPPPVAARSSANARAGAAATLVRVEGPGPSVAHRATALRALLGRFGEIGELAAQESRLLWREVRDAAPLAGPDRAVWRISVPPVAGAAVVAAVGARLGVIEALYDWGGGLVWLAVGEPGPDAGEREVRAAVAAAGGHATLIAASSEARAAVPVFQPQAEPLSRLAARVKEAFDPRRILNPGRMYAGQ